MSKRRACFFELAKLRGASLQSNVEYLATASLTVFLYIRGVLWLTFTWCLDVLMPISLQIKNSSYFLPSLKTGYSQVPIASMT